MQHHCDGCAAKRTATALVVHCVGTLLAETLMTAWHQAKRESHGATKQTSQESPVSADTVDDVAVAALLLAAVCGSFLSSSSTVSSSSSVAAWLSVIIMSVPTT